MLGQPLLHFVPYPINYQRKTKDAKNSKKKKKPSEKYSVQIKIWASEYELENLLQTYDALRLPGG